MTRWVAGKTLLGEMLNEDVRLALLSSKDPSAFGALYDRYILAVYRYIFSRIGHQQSAEDVTSQVFLEALEHIHKYRPIGTFAAWLFTIARRRTADYFRKAHPVQALEEEIAQDSVDLLSTVIRNEEYRQLNEHLQLLSEEERELLRLRFAAGLSFSDIGALLNKRPGAVKTATYRLLGRLERNMEESHD